MKSARWLWCAVVVMAAGFGGPRHVLSQDAPQASPSLKVLFLGDRGRNHRPYEKAEAIIPVLQKKGIDVVYTEDQSYLDLDKLQAFQVFMLFANIDRISPEHEKSLLTYVENGGGFAPIHCATFCFQNSEPVIALMGGQFRRHGTGVMGAVQAEIEHPILKNYKPFRSWDETYIHHKHNPENRIVLEYRKDGGQAEGVEQEPWTWVRTHGKGRVFYTAWGHDMRTWGHPGFQDLLERGLRWAGGSDEALPARPDDPVPAEEPAAQPAAPPARGQ